MDESGEDENKNKLTNPCTKIRARKDPDCQILLHFSDNLDGMIEREMRVLRTVSYSGKSKHRFRHACLYS